MPNRSEPFPEAEVRRWGRYSGAPTDEQLSRFFVLGSDDLERADPARSEVTRLGYAVQLCTVRFLGADPARTPQAVVRHVARQVGADPARWGEYVGSRARLVHQEAIRDAFGYSVFGSGTAHVAFLRRLWGRAGVSAPWSGGI